MAIKEELLELLRTDPEFREAAPRELFTEDLLLMPRRLDLLTARVESLAAAQQRTEAQVRELAAAQLRTEERLGALAGQMQRLATTQEELLLQIHRLSDWQRGEEGRREGERYERNTVRHARAIFRRGRDVTQRPEDLERLERALDPVMARPDLTEADDPLLAG